MVQGREEVMSMKWNIEERKGNENEIQFKFLEHKTVIVFRDAEKLEAMRREAREQAETYMSYHGLK
jgi:hypothetical protein